MYCHPTISPSYHPTTRGFTLIEVIVGMTVFSIGLTAIFALLSTTMTSASYARHETVVAGLLREQMELVKNIRDTNLKNYIAWDTVFVENNATSSWTG
jgi:prepilin-type N-terminal cleavage/methylation domain-containing protein